MRSLKRYLLNGLLFVLPMWLTVWFLVYAITTVDNLFRRFFSSIIADTSIFAPILKENYVFGFSLLVVVLLLIGVGWLATNYLGRLIRSWMDRLFEAVPLVNKIYHFVRQVTTSLGEGGSSAFKRVVMVQYPHPGMYAIGFVSNERIGGIMKDERGAGKMAVFVPTSPNPTSGFVLIVDECDSIPLDMSVENGLKFIISGGTLEIEGNDGPEQE